MLNRKLLAGLAAAAFCGAYAIDGSSQASAQAEIPAANAQTNAIVEGANGFLAILSDAQRKAVVFDFTDGAQRVALTGLRGSVLSAALLVIE